MAVAHHHKSTEEILKLKLDSLQIFDCIHPDEQHHIMTWVEKDPSPNKCGKTKTGKLCRKSQNKT